MSKEFIARIDPTFQLPDFIGNVPNWLKILPDDWDGWIIRAHIKISVSKLAYENIRFDLNGFLSEKLKISLKHIMLKYGMSEIHLKSVVNASIDTCSNNEVNYFHFIVEFERPGTGIYHPMKFILTDEDNINPK